MILSEQLAHQLYLSARSGHAKDTQNQLCILGGENVTVTGADSAPPRPPRDRESPDWCANWAALRSAKSLVLRKSAHGGNRPFGRRADPESRMLFTGRRASAGERRATATRPAQERGRVAAHRPGGQDAGEGAREEERKKRRIAR
jgi:hypothetical protein